MKFLDCMIAWTPANEDWGAEGQAAGSVTVGPWPDRSRWSDAYAMTEGACDMALHDLNSDARDLMLFIIFNKLVVRDGLDAMVVHEAFLAIDEYRQRLSPDTPGAD